MTTILVSSAGRRVGLIECWRKAAKRLGDDLTVLASDYSCATSAACWAADKSFSVPHCDSSDFVDSVLGICQSHGVDLIIPTIDTELQILSDNAPRFAGVGTTVHVSEPSVIRIVRDKAKTMEVLARANLPVPRTGSPQEVSSEPADWKWPLFLKPRSGSASRGLKIINSPAEIPTDFAEPMILQEYLEGPEFTINAFVDKSGVLKCAVPHERLSVRAGEVEKGVTRRSDTLEPLAAGIVNAIPALRGVFCFQVIVDRVRGPGIIEINARFGGGYPLADRAGARFCQWILEEQTNRTSTANNEWTDNILMLRFDQALFRENA